MNLKTSEKNQHASCRRATRRARNRSKGRGTKKKEKGDGVRRVEGKSTWYSMHVLSFLLALFLSQRRECRGLGGKTKCISRESVSNFPHRRKHDQSCPRQRGPSRPSSLPFDPPTIHDSLFVLFYLSSPLLVVFDDNEFWIFVFPLFLPFWAYDHSKAYMRDTTNRKCCHRLSRQNSIEIEVSGSSKSAFFSKGLHFIGCTLPGHVHHVLTKDTTRTFRGIWCWKSFRTLDGTKNDGNRITEIGTMTGTIQSINSCLPPLLCRS